MSCCGEWEVVDLGLITQCRGNGSMPALIVPLDFEGVRCFDNAVLVRLTATEYDIGFDDERTRLDGSFNGAELYLFERPAFSVNFKLDRRSRIDTVTIEHMGRSLYEFPKTEAA